jgi:amino acid adenylation domain-containing protein
MSLENIADIYSLSPMQQGMLFHSIYAPDSGEYIEQMCAGLRGKLDVFAFERAWQQVVARHPILRTAFIWEELDDPVQVVHENVELVVDQFDWRDLSPAEQQQKINEFLAAERRRGFVLTEAPLMRLALFHLAADQYQFAWTHHHLLLDGWSVPLLMEEVFAFYDAWQKGENLHRERSRPFRDYIAWLQQQDLASAEAFWRERLKGFSAPTPLVVERTVAADSARDSYNTVQEIVPENVTGKLQSLARAHQITLNTIVQAAWGLLLSRYSGESDVVFGATVSGRPADLVGAENMLGLFINTLPIRMKIKPELAVLTWLQSLQAQQAKLKQFEYSSLVQVQGWSEVPRDLPLFESLFVFESYPVAEAMKEGKQSLEINNIESFTRTSFPLTVAASPGKSIGLEILYDGQRFEPQMVRQIMAHLKNLLAQFAINIGQPVGQLSLLSPDETDRVLNAWNSGAVEYPQTQCIHHLIEARAAEQPKATAVIFKNQSITYQELNQRGNQLARHLRKLGVKPEMPVAICVDKSFEMVIGILGILKAGGGYVPIDPDYPAERIQFILADTRASVILTQAHHVEKLPDRKISVVCLDSDWEEYIADEASHNLKNGANSENLAYIIYTSGSTGRPKGVMLRHEGLCDFITAYTQLFEVDFSKRVLQFFSYGFDGSVGDIFMALTAGAALCLVDKANQMPGPGLNRFIERCQVTTAIVPPSVLAVLPEAGMPDLKVVSSGGDAVSRDLVARWAKDRVYLNVYGPTEATVVVSSFLTNQLSDQYSTVPIGKPLGNAKLYILDEHLQPVPVGVPGELHVAGNVLARGYLNRPDISAEKFIPNPFSALPGDRLYKTGDLARYFPDGNIEFLGRIDHQVKIRGFRIELGEIEEVLNEHSDIQLAVVLAREDRPGDKRLVGYFTVNDSRVPANRELQEFLKTRLPDYMVPAAFVPLEKFPVTANGKIDRKALPPPELNREAAGNEFIAPRNATEELLAEIWAQVLGVEKVGVLDNFFELGGHSLIGVKLQSRINDAFDVEMQLRRIFEAPTIAELAKLLDGGSEETAAAPEILPVPREENFPLSFAQQRLWFLDQLEPNSPFYNIPTALRFQGRLHLAAFRQSLAVLIQRHESLRTTFGEQDGKPFQVFAEGIELPLEIRDLTLQSVSEKEITVQQMALAEARQPFDLKTGPLFRATIIQLAETECVVLFTMHHIISDGWSVTVLIQELAALYQSFVNGQSSPLAELPIQYADYAAWQRHWLQGEILDAHLTYWKEKLADCPPLIELPTDRPRPPVQSFNGNTISTTFAPELALAVHQLSREEGCTPFMTLLATFQTLLARYSRQDDICVGTPVANRNRLATEGLIGFFVNTLVLRTDLSGNPTFLELLARVRETALGAFAHQDLPFETIVEAVQPQRDLSHTPLFQVMFVLQNETRQDISVPDLQISPIEADSGNAKFDLTLIIADSPDSFSVSFEYNTDLFDQSTIERLLRHFNNLLQSIVADPERTLAVLPWLDAQEQQQIFREWNTTTMEFPETLCMHQWFEKIALDQPDAPALIFNAETLTYAELNRRANQLAQFLKKRGVQAESLVGICLERSLEMVVSILGTLKAGGAFIPLDPAYPAERLEYMLQDSRARVLLTQQALADRFRDYDARVIAVDTTGTEIAAESDENLNLPLTPTNLAYVIYTSGSTGKPKGTMLQHRGWCNLGRVQQHAFGVGPGSRILQFSSLSFDASVWEMVMALLSGSALCLTSREMLTTGQGLQEVFLKNRITTVTLPPSVLAVVPEIDFPDLKTIITAGEACTTDLVARWNQGRQFFNAYGPTESTVCASMFRVPENYSKNPPIGKPIGNFKLYVLDENLQPLPVGVPGELLIGGISLARGYLNRPELTAEKFVPDPFSPDPGARMYRSGDLARFLPDGNLEFLGRIDHQVKVRGFRIELGEIEAVLGEHPQILDVKVIVREDIAGDKRIVAYLVPEASTGFSVSGLRSFLREKLPDYMLPSIFITLEALPLTPNGKIDRKALPVPDQSRPDLESAYVAPRNEIEENLAKICADLLGIEKIGVYDNFFELGGHSLLATQFLSRLRNIFEIELPLRILFEKPVIAELALEIEVARKNGASQQAPAIKRISRDTRRVKRSTMTSGGA